MLQLFPVHCSYLHLLSTAMLATVVFSLCVLFALYALHGVSAADIFVSVTPQLDSDYHGSFGSVLVVTDRTLTVVTVDQSNVTLPQGTLVLTAGDGMGAGVWSWANIDQIGRQWIKIKGGDALYDISRVSCSSNNPLLIVTYADSGDDGYLVTTTDINNWQRQPLESGPPIGDFVDTSCVIGSGGKIYWFFGLFADTLNTYNNTATWLGQAQISGSDVSIDWTKAKGNNSLQGHYQVLTTVHRNNSHLNGSDVLYAVDGFLWPANTNHTAGVQEVPLSQVAASLDGVQWYVLPPVPWISDSSLIEAVTVSDDGVIMFTDTSSAAYASLDGGLTFGLCTNSLPWKTERAEAAVTFDHYGNLWLIGGYNKADVWKSTFAWSDYSAVAKACGLSVPKGGIGLTVWPPAGSKPLARRGSVRLVNTAL